MLVHGIIALIVALVIAALLVTTLRRRAPGPWSGFLFFFILFFGFVWAAGVWIHPLEDSTIGAAWPSFSLAGILMLLIIAAVTAPGQTDDSKPPEEWRDGEEAERKVLELTVSIFFWLALIGSAALVVAAYT